MRPLVRPAALGRPSLPDAELKTLLGVVQFERITPGTVSSRRALIAGLKAVRRSGVSTVDSGTVAGVVSVAAPIFWGTGAGRRGAEHRRAFGAHRVAPARYRVGGLRRRRRDLEGPRLSRRMAADALIALGHLQQIGDFDALDAPQVDNMVAPRVGLHLQAFMWATVPCSSAQ